MKQASTPTQNPASPVASLFPRFAFEEGRTLFSAPRCALRPLSPPHLAIRLVCFMPLVRPLFLPLVPSVALVLPLVVRCRTQSRFDNVMATAQRQRQQQQQRQTEQTDTFPSTLSSSLSRSLQWSSRRVSCSIVEIVGSCLRKAHSRRRL